MSMKFCNSLTKYSRFKTREVQIGDTPLGGNNPIRVQSMTTVDTMNTEGSVAEAIRMIEAGCEYVRITAPSKKEAENLKNIKAGLLAKGFNTPLVADIHFTPNAAEIAAKYVEKVRVNPGNYADKKKFDLIEYSDEEYQDELHRIKTKFKPLVDICKENKVALRIGTNHGSLSDRILSRYGDTPLGMVESAMEFIRFCEEFEFYDLVISMKASNPQVMVQAYRLLNATMIENGQNYPLHLGVTEAGDGEDGRVKSAVGIGALLEDGLGDTVRVSLTEDPEEEMPVARKLISRYTNRENHQPIKPLQTIPFNPFHYEKTFAKQVADFGGDLHPIVLLDLSNSQVDLYETYKKIGYDYNQELDKYNIADIAADYVYLGKQIPALYLPGNLKQIYDYQIWKNIQPDLKENTYPLCTWEEFLKEENLSETVNFVKIKAENIYDKIEVLKNTDRKIVLVLSTENKHCMPQLRRAMFELKNNKIDIPIVYSKEYNVSDEEQYTLDASADIGPLFLDGFGQGIFITNPLVDIEKTTKLSFSILQATRTRISKTEYISCPSCGRTLFNLQETTQMIRAKTNHLKGLKIGIMGCIVNGPGEMADADYGYVGSGVGKITLYRGQEVVKRQINSENALDELIGIIKDDGKWLDPQSVIND